MNTRGVQFTLEQVLRLVLALISISVLFLFVMSVSDFFTKNTKLEQAEIQFERLTATLDRVADGPSNSGERVLLEGPADWWILAYPYSRASEPADRIFSPSPSCGEGIPCVCFCPAEIESSFLGSSYQETAFLCQQQGMCRNSSLLVETYDRRLAGQSIWQKLASLNVGFHRPIVLEGPVEFSVEKPDEDTLFLVVYG